MDCVCNTHDIPMDTLDHGEKMALQNYCTGVCCTFVHKQLIKEFSHILTGAMDVRLLSLRKRLFHSMMFISTNWFLPGNMKCVPLADRLTIAERWRMKLNQWRHRQYSREGRVGGTTSSAVEAVGREGVGPGRQKRQCWRDFIKPRHFQHKFLQHRIVFRHPKKWLFLSLSLAEAGHLSCCWMYPTKIFPFLRATNAYRLGLPGGAFPAGRCRTCDIRTRCTRPPVEGPALAAARLCSPRESAPHQVGNSRSKQTTTLGLTSVEITHFSKSKQNSLKHI